jgi:PAS domain S-box-containing protein
VRRPRFALPAATYGALALAVAFVLATLSVLRHLSTQQHAVESGARAVRRLTELSNAVRSLEHEAVQDHPGSSEEEEAALLLKVVDRCEEARRALGVEPVAGVDLSACLARFDACFEEMRALLPGLPRSRREPEATLREAQRLGRSTRAAEEELGEASRQVRIRLTELSLEMRDSTERCSSLLVIACVAVGLVAGLLVLRQRDFSRLLAEQRARMALDERLNVVLQNVPAVLWSTDRELRITSSHGAALREIGLKPGEVVGQTLFQYFGTDDRSFEPIARHLRALAGESQRYEYTWLGRTFLSLLVPLREGGAAPSGVLGVGLDVTELKEAERALADSTARVRHLQKMEAIGRLADTVAHDFNNFLTVILGNAGIALTALPPDSSARAELEEIERTAERAAQLTRQLLAFGRPRSFAPEPVDLNALVRGLERILRRQCGESVRLVLDLSPRPATVAAHPAQMEQILLNLAINARDAMPQGGTLTIATRAPEGADRMVTLTVRDTGVGIDEGVRQRLFEPFFSTKAADEGGQGTGLGLAIVDSIVRERGGTISVESAPGRGSAFVVRLPAAPQEAVPEAEVAEEAGAGAPGGRGETVLLVEDDDAVRSLGRRALEANGYQVIEARSGEEAIDLLSRRGGRVDLLLTDRRMPRMSGDALARRCLAEKAAGSVLFMSTHPGPEEAARTQDGEAAEFLAKPFTSSELLRRVREALDRPAAR